MPRTKPSTITVYDHAPSPVRHAAHRLAQFTGIPVEGASARGKSIRIGLSTRSRRRIGPQGYRIRTSGNGNIITIRGNTGEGAANGVYTFLRTLMIDHRKDPFMKAWDIEEQPQFAVRSMLVSPYRFGASYGFAALSPDRWSLAEWKRYVDFMRLCNMTTLVMGSERVYHPAYPHSEREKWRYDVWKDVMAYCHQVGLKFNWFISPNLVTEQAFWDNPDKRAVQEAGSWFGNGLNWSTGKDVILENQRYTFEHFRGLDGLEIIYSDGGGFSFDEQTGADPAGYFGDATRSYIQLLRDTGNDATFLFWNWLLDFWSQVLLPEHVLQKYPKYRTMQDDVIPLLPQGVAWVDASLLTLAQVFRHPIQLRGNPPLRDTVLLGKESGFKPVIDIFWYMNPELAINMFPRPYIQRGIQEAQYARDELGVDGVMGYRLAPPCRYVDDYVFFRLASDPSLTQEQIVTELAGLLAEESESQRQVTEAINILERFGTTHALEEIELAKTILDELVKHEPSRDLEYLSNGVTFLTYIARLAQPGVTDAERAALKRQLYSTVKPMYIFQGLTADIVWIPEAVRFFNARVDMMVEDYRSPMYEGAEVVDRAIYPRATSEPFALRWPV